jgi:saccharopine dehydrogenase-like NADP-dependent oxidoreductase
MQKVLVLGAGKIGVTIAHLLADAGGYALNVADWNPESRAHVPEGVPFSQVDASDAASLRSALQGIDTVVNACPYHLNETIAIAARDSGVHYFDLTEDTAAAHAIRRIAQGAQTAFVPQCGLAPGFVGIVGMSLARTFDHLETLKLRVGALPKYGTNALGYSLTWSTEGLINEYLNPCEVVVGGRRGEAQPLEGLETFSMDGMAYEAFHTSGGLGTLAETLDGRVQNLDYKSIRYPGHCERIRLLAQDLGLGRRRDLFKQVLELALPTTVQDVVVMLVTAIGSRGGRLVQETFARKILGRSFSGTAWSAIQLATATAACAMVDLHGEGRLPARGFVRQEEARLEDFLANRFGLVYA